MSLIVVLAIVVAYLALVLFVVAMLIGAKRADEDIERAVRAEQRRRSRFGAEDEEPHPQLAAIAEEEPRARRGAA
jgi:uncharacterized membrane protein